MPDTTHQEAEQMSAAEIEAFQREQFFADEDAAAAYLATLSGPEQRNTQRAYRSTLRALTAEFAPPSTHVLLAEVNDEQSVDRLTTWFTRQWSGRAAATLTGTWTPSAPR